MMMKRHTTSSSSFLLLLLQLIVFSIITTCNAAFHHHHHHLMKEKSALVSSSSSSFSTKNTELFMSSTQEQMMSSNTNTMISVDRSTAYRDVETFQNWAVQYGVQVENGFYLSPSSPSSNDLDIDDWCVGTSTGIDVSQSQQRVLYVPNTMILSARTISEEYQAYTENSLDILASKGLIKFEQQYYLFLRLLIEYEQGANSPFYPWLNSLPRKYNTAVSMDEFCLSCLPPFIKSLCNFERSRYNGFVDALKKFDYVSQQTKSNSEVTKFLFNVVNTRSFKTGSECSAEDVRIVPVADYLNHGYPSNVELQYDEYSNCHVMTTPGNNNIQPNTQLCLSYGQESNPSRFFATYGFLNDMAPATYCKLLLPNPSKELVDIGYDPSRLLFGTIDGDISPEVWDVVLYSRIERKPDLESDKVAFYQACMNNDQETKSYIHSKYLRDTTRALQRHVNHILAELADLKVKTNSYDSSKHPRLPLIRKHNDMVTSTFQKVKENLDQMF